MTGEEYIAGLRDRFIVVQVLSRRNDCQVLRLRNRENGAELVLRFFPEEIPAYEKLQGLSCKNLPRVYDVLRVSDGQIVLEEYIDGITVAQVMETGRYRKRGAAKVLEGVCGGLAALHGLGLVHRDVKPENVMISRTGQVILLDLNASRQVSENAVQDTKILGTVGYAAPEQMGITQSDARTDIFAAGVLLNVMLTGKHPAEGIARGRLGRIVRKCTATDPKDRYPTAAALFRAL